MDLAELLAFLHKDFPEQSQKLLNNIQTSIDIIEEIRKDINKKSYQLSEQENYEKSDEYLTMCKKITKLKNVIHTNFFSSFSGKMAQNNFETDTKIKTEYEEFRLDYKGLEKVYVYRKEQLPFTDKERIKPIAFSLNGVIYPIKNWYELLVKTSEILFQKDSKLFNSFIGLPLSGFIVNPKKVYFTSIPDLFTNPKKIPKANIYINCLSANTNVLLTAYLFDKFNIKGTIRIPKASISMPEVDDNASNKSKNTIYIVENDLLNKNICPLCNEKLDWEDFCITYKGIKKVLKIRTCSHCCKKYISNYLYKQFSINKDLSLLDVEFEHLYA